MSQAANYFLTFHLDREEYGINILKVQEVLGHDSITPIANVISLDLNQMRPSLSLSWTINILWDRVLLKIA